MLKLFSPIKIREKSINNRIAIAPMVCYGWSTEDGIISKGNVEHYEARAKAGTGLIIIEAHCIVPDGRLSPTQLGIWSDQHIEGISEIAKACQKHGSKVILQLHHAGYKTHVGVSTNPVAPSDYKTAREMTLNEIKEIQKAFLDAAIRAKKAGVDGVELHGAHSYLMNQFTAPTVNKRTDMYGGSLENRLRFTLEVIEAIKALAFDDFIIGYRMGLNDPTFEDDIQTAKVLEKAGLDLLHVSSGYFEEEPPKTPEGFNYNWIVYGGTVIKKHVNIPVIGVNNISTPKKASYLIENNLLDFVAIGKPMLADSKWTKKAKENPYSDVLLCQTCTKCAWFNDNTKCPGKNNL